jgi:thymidylate synthase ThyX
MDGDEYKKLRKICQKLRSEYWSHEALDRVGALNEKYAKRMLEIEGHISFLEMELALEPMDRNWT